MKKKQTLYIQVDHRSTEPEYEQIAKQVRSLILTHQFSVDLLDISHLVEMLDVDEDVVIKAFDILEREQMISKQDDKYELTYQEVVDINDETITSAVEMIKALNQSFSMDVFDEKYMIADELFCSKVPFLLGEEIYTHKRIYFGDRYPKSYMELYFSKTLMPDIDQEAYVHMPYYEILSFDQDYILPYEKRLRAIKLDDYINKILLQSKGTSGFLSEEFYYNEYHQLMFYAKLYMNMNFFIRFKD